jgi:LPXTG-motif cell wall-anchored protein
MKRILLALLSALMLMLAVPASATSETQPEDVSLSNSHVCESYGDEDVEPGYTLYHFVAVHTTDTPDASFTANFTEGDVTVDAWKHTGGTWHFNVVVDSAWTLEDGVAHDVVWNNKGKGVRVNLSHCTVGEEPPVEPEPIWEVDTDCDYVYLNVTEGVVDVDGQEYGIGEYKFDGTVTIDGEQYSHDNCPPPPPCEETEDCPTPEPTPTPTPRPTPKPTPPPPHVEPVADVTWDCNNGGVVTLDNSKSETDVTFYVNGVAYTNESGEVRDIPFSPDEDTTWDVTVTALDDVLASGEFEVDCVQPEPEPITMPEPTPEPPVLEPPVVIERPEPTPTPEELPRTGAGSAILLLLGVATLGGGLAIRFKF